MVERIDPNNLSAEQKRQIMGQSNFCCLAIFSIVAFSCGVAVSSYCSFASRNIVLTDNAETICNNLGIAQDQCVLLQNHGVGLYGWQTTVLTLVNGVPQEMVRCFSYTQRIGNVYVTPHLDSNYWGARYCSIVADVFGGIAFITIWLATCCPLSPQRLQALGCNFFIATLFQGLTFLMFQSNVCDKGFFDAYLRVLGSSSDQVVESVSCGLDIGSRLSIASTVFYFLCMCTLPTALPPAPVGLQPQQREAAANGDEAAAAAGDVEEVGGDDGEK